MNTMHQYRSKIENKARQIVQDNDFISSKKYCDNWFGATGFFGETFQTGIRKGRFFITRDEWINDTVIYALREITPGGIETIGGPLDSYEEAEELLRQQPKHPGETK